MSVMRKEYRKLSEEEMADIAELKELGDKFVAKVDATKAGREMSLAKTRMEEAVFWAVKGITG